MRMQKRLIGSCLIVACALLNAGGISRSLSEPTATSSAPATSPVTHSLIESYPSRIQARLESRNRFLSNLPHHIGGLHPQFIINSLKTWAPGQTVKVAFLGGDSTLHRDIAEATKDWTAEGNLKLDFGFNQATGTFRQWKTTDQAFSADVRVSFDQDGYWSLVGTDSINPQVTSPKEASLNLQGFDIQRPGDWRAVVLHEFGHALGFEHEHQHPTEGCDADFRFNDDPGYVPTTDQYGQFIPDNQVPAHRPGIYTVLGGPPNNWSKSMVDFNLKQLPSIDSHAFPAFATSAFDRNSIMKYYFPAWMFVGGTQSHCFSQGENLILSAEDKQGFKATYPLDQPGVDAVVMGQRTMLNNLIQAPGLHPAAKSFYELKRRNLTQ